MIFALCRTVQPQISTATAITKTPISNTPSDPCRRLEVALRGQHGPLHVPSAIGERARCFSLPSSAYNSVP